MLHGYERGLDLALRWRLTTLTIFFATLALSVYLFVIIPKGFFPQQDIGLITATSEAAQDISFAAMVKKQETLGKIVQADPDVASVAMAIGGSGRAGNNGNLFITLKPRDRARRRAPSRSSPGCGPSSKRSRARGCIMQAAQDVRLGGRPTRTQFEFTLQDANLDELSEWAPKILAKMQTLPELRDVATDQQSEGTTLQLQDQPRHRLALRHPAATDRRHALRRVRPASGHAVFHPAQQLPRDPGNPAGAAGQPRHPQQALHQVAADRRAGAVGDVRDLDQRAGPFALDQPSGPVSGHHHQLQPRPGRRARAGHRRRAAGDGRSRRAGHAELELPGHRAGVPAIARHRAAVDHGGAGGGVPDPRHSL